MKKIKTWLLLLCLCNCGMAYAQNLQDSFYVKILNEELQRNVQRLQLPDLEKPFFIAYNMRTYYSYGLNAERGVITSTLNVPVTNRSVSVKLRVGDYHRNFDYMMYDGYFINLPDEVNADEYKRLLWLETDRAYKNNAQQYSNYLTSLKRLTIDKIELALDDMSKIKPIVHDYGAMETLIIDKNKWKQQLKSLSAMFNQYPQITSSYCTLSINNYEDYLVSSEGTIVRKPGGSVSFIAYGSMSDNEEGGNYNSSYSITVKDINEMPSFDSLQRAVKKIITTIKLKEKAKPFEGSYMGPVLFTENAIGNIIYECFVNILPVKRKSILGYDAGEVDYEEKLGQKLVSGDLTLTAVPSLEKFNGKKTTGFYKIDDEGVCPPDSLVLIQNGILKALINGRTPTKKFPVSQGFAQSFMGKNYNAGVLKLTAAKTAPADSIVKRLLQLAKEEGLPSAYIVNDYSYNNAEIYKINVATGETEMVNACKMTPLNLKSLRRFAIASDKMQLMNATDFSIIASESIIVNEVEIEKVDNTTTPKPIVVSNPLLDKTIVADDYKPKNKKAVR